jgi:hypothetical protein
MKFAGHPFIEGENKSENRIYDVSDIGKLKNAIFLKDEMLYPKSVGTIKIVSDKKGVGDYLRNLVRENIQKYVLKENIFRDVNNKPAENFDKLYGTKLSKSYDFSPYTEDEVWDFWVDCRDEKNCENFNKVMDMLPEKFPYIDVSKLDYKTKKDILVGMVSGFNPEDIYFFSVLGVGYSQNVEQKELEMEIPYEVTKNIHWVLSPGSIKVIRTKFTM